ncbi:MAG: hypothetical protein P4L40_03940 [Terracidiphilus sp.]|nr:hypothetical protein [Terracidiphilus sp.]
MCECVCVCVASPPAVWRSKVKKKAKKATQPMFFPTAQMSLLDIKKNLAKGSLRVGSPSCLYGEAGGVRVAHSARACWLVCVCCPVSVFGVLQRDVCVCLRVCVCVALCV